MFIFSVISSFITKKITNIAIVVYMWREKNTTKILELFFRSSTIFWPVSEIVPGRRNNSRFRKSACICFFVDFWYALLGQVVQKFFPPLLCLPKTLPPKILPIISSTFKKYKVKVFFQVFLQQSFFRPSNFQKVLRSTKFFKYFKN